MDQEMGELTHSGFLGRAQETRPVGKGALAQLLPSHSSTSIITPTRRAVPRKIHFSPLERGPLSPGPGLVPGKRMITSEFSPKMVLSTPHPATQSSRASWVLLPVHTHGIPK